MKSKIIFLDCDGVLNRIVSGDPRYFHPECFACFQRIVYTTGAKVVLSTSWREFMDWENMLRDFFGAINIRVVGKTPILNGHPRPDEIRQYLNDHADEIDNYVVLDDIDMRSDFPGHCICTCDVRRIGLDDAWAREAIAILDTDIHK